MPDTRVKAICFYLPQFHPIPENDEWWGKGFTEWRNVAKAKPQFPGHYQPHIPADLGFYDLRLPEAREAQAELAREYGIHGFCYYHYWFNGRRILERPFNEVLASGKPDLPFCLCWANENWTRRWTGGERDVLLRQNYSHEDDLAHIRSLLPALHDERYVRINGKPLFLVYRAELLPEPARTAEIWRDVARKAGVGDLYLARVESYNSVIRGVKAPDLGFDADVEFAPFSWNIGSVRHRGRIARLLASLGFLPKVFLKNKIIPYDAMVRGMLDRPEADWVRFPCVTPGWDNTARRKEGATILQGSTPQAYESWSREVFTRTVRKHEGDERIIFINAWNEWAEGNHLEPDLYWGRAYLEATRKALQTEDTKEPPA
ncbi:MAG TPA: glycoside hydrolase family 99-like domain-containing protein [Gammaproteobacteria bacterium]|nr:glycoside hydrolase family 99-like domain-containing protein [Gammaproteobacteria bacterium]